MKKLITTLVLVSVVLISCSKSSNSSSNNNSNTSTTQSDTWVKLNIVNAAGAPVSGYKVMMFKSPVTSVSALPTIEREVTSDANGLAFFDLKTQITSDVPVRYYFEAFIQTGTGYTWESVTHYNVELKKGTQATSSIIVN